MAQVPVKILLGAFAAGEVPPPLLHQFLDFSGEVINLTGFTTLDMNIEVIPSVTGPLGDGTVTVTDAPNGKVQYEWTSTDMADPGDYVAQLWVSNGTNWYASDPIEFSVYDGPGVAP